MEIDHIKIASYAFAMGNLKYVVLYARLDICFAMDSIELSLILDCFSDQKAIENTKT